MTETDAGRKQRYSQSQDNVFDIQDIELDITITWVNLDSLTVKNKNTKY